MTIHGVNDAPVLSSAALTVEQGGTTVLTNAAFGIADPDSTSFTYTVSNVTHGVFQTYDGTTWTDATSFTTAEVAAGHVQFVHDGSTTAPGFDIQADDGATVDNLSAVIAGTANLTDVNVPPSGAVTIDGTAAEDQVLTANVSGLSDADGLGTLHYQWLRDGSNVGSDQSTYTLGDADVGAKLSVRVSYTDGHGTAESVTSAQTAAVANVNDAPAGAVTIDGTAAEDQVLTANVSGLSDADGLGTLHYQWLRDGSNVGSDQSTYTLGDADVGAKLSVRVSYTDGHGTAESVTSAQTAAVANVNDAPAGAVTIDGTAAEDQVLTANVSGLSDADGLGTLHYQWLRDGSNVGSDQSTYTLGDADVGAKLSVRVSYTDGHGTAESVTSAQTAAVANVNDAPAGAVTINGTADGGPGPDRERLGPERRGRSRHAALPVAARRVECRQRPVDLHAGRRRRGRQDLGSGELHRRPRHGGERDQRADGGGRERQRCADRRGDDQRDGDRGPGPDRERLGPERRRRARHAALPVAARRVESSAADQSTYTLGDADVGAKISVRVSYTDGHGTAESVTSAQTAAVANVNDAPTGAVTIDGTADGGPGPDREHLGPGRRRRARHAALPVAARRVECRQRPVDLHAGRRRRGRQDLGSGELHRRPRHGGERDQRADGCGRERQRCAGAEQRGVLGVGKATRRCSAPPTSA